MMRRQLALSLACLLSASPLLAGQPPRAVRTYTSCVAENFRNPGEERSDVFEEARQLAMAQCGNLRPAAASALRRTITKNMTTGGDDPESAAQALLDVVTLEQTAAIWSQWHPEEPYHGR